MPTGTKAEKQAKRRKVAGALVAGKRLGAAAKDAGCSKRHVQSLAQGKETAPEDRDGLVTWEEFVVLFRSRKESHAGSASDRPAVG